MTATAAGRLGAETSSKQESAPTHLNFEDVLEHATLKALQGMMIVRDLNL